MFSDVDYGYIGRRLVVACNCEDKFSRASPRVWDRRSSPDIIKLPLIDWIASAVIRLAMTMVGSDRIATTVGRSRK